MIACYENFIGIASEQNPIAPKSGLYLDKNVIGIDVKRMANIASDASGLELIKKSIANACDEVAEEALNFNGSSIQTSAVGFRYYESKFRDTVLASSNQERGIEFEIKRPDFYQFSNIYITKVYVKANTDESAVVIKIIDGQTTESLEPIDLVAGEIYELDLEYKAKNKAVRIVTDHSHIQFYQSYIPAHTNKGCSSCGGRKVNNYSDSVPTLWVTGGHGITADIELRCDTQKIKCAMLSELRYAILYKSAMLLAIEGEFTDRLNFYSANTNFDDFYEYLEGEYLTRMERISPSIMQRFKGFDRNCFECGNVKKSNLGY